MATNIINAKLGCPDVTVWADWGWQYDYGQILKLSGVDLPEAYEVHFSNQETGGTTVTQIGNADGVTVPDQFFLNGQNIFVWVFLHEALEDGETIYKVVIPIKARPQPSDAVPTPVEQSEITQAIAALNQAVEETAAAQEAAENAQDAAELAQGKAEDAQEAAEIAQGKAEDAQEAAETAQGKAEDAQEAAEGYANAAATSEQNALDYSKTSKSWAVGGTGTRSGEDIDNSKYYSEVAQQAATTAGFIDIEIDENGHLIYTRSDTVDIQFSLEDGHLILEVA